MVLLNSDLKQRVYMRVPCDIVNVTNMLCLLDQAIKGLKKANRAGNNTIHAVFMQIGFKRSSAIQCVYVKGF